MLLLDAAKPEYFARNFVWHFMTPNGGLDINSTATNRSFIEFSLTPRYQTAFNLQKLVDLIFSVLVFESNEMSFRYLLWTIMDISTLIWLWGPSLLSGELKLESCEKHANFREICQKLRNMVKKSAFPLDMKYLTCSQYDGQNTPRRDIDLRQHFVEADPRGILAAYFILPTNKDSPFNGRAFVKFGVSILAKGRSQDIQILGHWHASLNDPILIHSNINMTNFTADVVYRVITVVVSTTPLCWRMKAFRLKSH